MSDTVLRVEKLYCDFLTIEGIVYAVSGADLAVKRGEIHGLVGESGCGKSVSSRAVMGLLDKRHSRLKGRVMFGGRNLLELSEAEMRSIRGRQIAMIFQDPLNSLSPLVPVGRQIEEAMANHSFLSPEERKNRMRYLLERVGLHRGVETQYPFELSGGMQQRIMIAQAVSCEPQLIIADEPTTALDVTIQAQALDLLRELQKELSLSVLLITHNFSVVAEICDTVSVMYSGRVVETAPARALIEGAAHPYSRALIDCIPRRKRGHVLPVIPGFPPRLYDPVSGCPFAPRCSLADKACVEPPPCVEGEGGRKVFCHHPGVMR
ncbi:ABC transporter ATP-binding protein [Leadbettera azotonutricia]|uniref:Dipeptide transport ATP-binding protein DppD n=1 Tax=Leadbettera azotonutricia (strain ATCC BAA-888 / DSM 13862 / ZAS-9) TaxID=545695 RepID=F5Y7A8_LEAAZ|nr:ABC transporter ATP-binding protein [Leadbettera azotonutricia]AEF81121.1 dipeptide transport ATP-binding protein DppD [Leadbettera azotonutricia ZAS-9]